MNEKLKLEVLLSAIDQVTAPLKAIREGSGTTASALKAAKDQLKALNAEQRRVDEWRQTAKNIAVYKNMLGQAEERVKAAANAMKSGEYATQAQQRAFKEARNEANALKLKISSLTEKQQRLRVEFTEAGVDTRNLVGYQKQLKSAMADATVAVDRQSKALDERRKVMQRYGAARAAYEKTTAQRERLENAGTRTLAVGAALGLPVAKAAKDYATFEEAMLGVARQVQGARDANGKLTKTYYEMADAIKAMGERIPMATTDIAKIVEAGARMGIQGKENLVIYAQLTATMADAFDLPVEEVGQNIGKLSQLYRIPIKDIGALGDTINWLDDNALSKGGDIIEVMQRIAGTAGLVNMNFKEAAALGSTFLSMGATPEIAATASNAMIGQLANAPMLATAKRYREGLAMLKLDAKELQQGMNKDATGTILKVLEAIKALPQDKQLEAATRLFGKEYGDDASKMAQNLDEYRRQLLLVNEAQAKGSMQREADARKQTINANIRMAKNALFNMASDFGQTLKPALLETMQRTIAIVQGIRAWAKENPGLAAGIITVVKYLALAVTVIGGLMLAAAGVLAPIAAMKFGLAAIGVSGGAAATGVWAVLKPVMLVAGAFYAGWQAGKLLGAGIDWLLSKVLGYKTTLGGAIFDLVQYVTALPARFMAAGGQMVDGLINGIKQRWQALKNAVGGIADGAVGWFKDKLGIRSPSRVFAQIGGYTMEGLQQGIAGGKNGALGALNKVTKQLTAAGAGMAIGASAMAMPIDTRGPLSPAGGAGGAATMIVQITVNPSPGMDEAALAKLVAAEIQRVQSQAAARGRSRLTDSE